MQGQDESSPHTGDTYRHVRQEGCVANGIIGGTFIVVGTLSFLLINALLAEGQSPRWQLAFGAATYAIAIVAALLAGPTTKLRLLSLRLVLVSLAVSLLVWPTFVGSMCIVYALFHLAGSHAGGSAAMWALAVWAVVSVPLVAYTRRTAVHG